MTLSRFGWLGTGRMGAVMAARLLPAAPELTVWNRTPSKCESLVDQGAQHVHALHELAECDAVFICVTKSDDLLDVVTGPAGLLSAESTPRIVVDCSTVSVEASAQVREALAKRGVVFLAAPISGNPDMVREGAAALAVSGPRDAYDELLPIMRAIAPTVAYVGEAEQSRLVKICHNLFLAVITQGLTEVVTLAQKAGIDDADFLHFINGSVLGSPFIRHKGDAITQRNFTPTFRTVDMRKDFDIGLAAARELEVPMPLGAATAQLVQTSIGHGNGELDYVALYLLQAAAAGIRQ